MVAISCEGDEGKCTWGDFKPCALGDTRTEKLICWDRGDRGIGEGRFRMDFVCIIERLWVLTPLRRIEEVWEAIMVVRFEGDKERFAKKEFVVFSGGTSSVLTSKATSMTSIWLVSWEMMKRAGAPR